MSTTSCLKKGFVGAVKTPRATVLRNVFPAWQAYIYVLCYTRIQVFSWHPARGNLHQHRGNLPPTVSHFSFFLLPQGGVQELRMDQPCGPLLYVPGSFFKVLLPDFFF
jgi:hypothetical protein